MSPPGAGNGGSRPLTPILLRAAVILRAEGPKDPIREARGVPRFALSIDHSPRVAREFSVIARLSVMLNAEIRHDWAHQTFGHAELGNRKRTRRLVAMAARLAAEPSGTVTGSFADSASREGAFRWLASDRGELGRGRRCARPRCVRARERPRVLRRRRLEPAADGPRALARHRQHRRVALRHAWSAGDDVRAHGRVGDAARRTRRPLLGPHRAKPPLQRSTAQDDEDGDAPRRRSSPRHRSAPRRARARRARALRARSRLRCVGHLSRSARPRARHDRSLTRRPRHLPIRGRKAPFAASRPSSARRCSVTRISTCPRVPDERLVSPCSKCERRAWPIELSLSRQTREPLEITAVLAREVGRSGDRLDWLLLTTDHVRSLDDAHRVLDGYAMRWRIEELHRAWKSGWCNVEKTQLRSREALCKWATLHLAVAARAIHLSRRARTEPDVLRPKSFRATRSTSRSSTNGSAPN